MMTKPDAEEFLKFISNDRKLLAQLWKMMAEDQKNIQVLVDNLKEYVDRGGRIPTG